MKIAKPLLLVSTPIGVVWGVVEAYRFHPWLAGLMGILVAIVGAFFGYTVHVIRREHSASQRTLIDDQLLKAQRQNVSEFEIKDEY